MKKYNPLQELDTSPDSEFIRAVDFVVQEKIPATHIRKTVYMGVTPLVLRLCDSDIGIIKARTTYGVIEKVISEFINRPNDNRRYKRIHNIDPEDLKKIPALICDPVAVIQSQTVADYSSENKKQDKPNGFVILIELTETKKSSRQNWLAPSLVAIHYSYNKKHKEMDLNITSAYGKPMGFWIDNLSSNLLMYLNREKCRQFIKTFLTPEVRRRLNSKEDSEKIRIISEMCYTEIHKDRSLNTAECSVQGRCYFKESGHLYETNNNAKSETMQEEMHKGRFSLKACDSPNDSRDLYQTNDLLPNDTKQIGITQTVKQKISPKQPKRTIPTPTGYKTEEDLRLFRLDMVKRHFQDQLSTLPESERNKILAYEKGASEIWERLPDEKIRNALATNFYTNAARSIENGEKLPLAMSNAAAKDVLENRRENNEPDINIDDDIEIDR
ncbi:MAG: hypothetical protein IJ780_02135 [Neisseriaceae bacterium]|nr:hypothetical protein [Neisseriaceae bacterium]